jgi:hypothetical protein
MQLSSSPQTGIRQVSKCFRLLYPLEDQLNSYIHQFVDPHNKISTVQVFFDTDINDDNYVKLLSLRDKILQVETSLIWEDFSKMDRKEQELVFIKKLHKVAIQVAKKYKIDNKQIELAFSNLLVEIEQEK